MVVMKTEAVTSLTINDVIEKVSFLNNKSEGLAI